MKKNQLLTGAISLIIAAFFLSACSNTKPAETQPSANIPEEASDDSASDYPLVIPHAYGETVIESKPERIAAIGWENQDTPLALGIVPVGISAANYGFVTENRLHPWTSDAITASGQETPVVFDDIDGLDYEAINDVQPDVILASYSGVTKEEYEMLSQIAPVISYPTAPWQTYWREQTIMNAAGMGMKKEGESKVAEVEALIQEKTSAHPELAGTRTAFCFISPDDFSTFYVYLPSDPRAAYLTDLGLAFPESILKLAEGTNDFSIALSRENADKLSDVEMMVVYGDENLLSALKADPLMSEIPAVKNGAVALVENDSALAGACTPSILSIPAEIDEYLDLLSKAHGKIQ